MDTIITHWPLLAFALVTMVLGQTAKGVAWTKERASKALWAWYMRKTLPLHPVICGFVFGLLPGVTQTTDLEGWIAAPLYYAMGGVMSTWTYSVISGFFKKRGVELKTDPVSMPPKPGDPPPLPEKKP